MRPSISTRTGDAGTTGLFGGKRVQKSDVRIHAYGTVDELNSILGTVLSDAEVPEALQADLLSVQKTLFAIGSDLATPADSTLQVDRLREQTVTLLEQRGAVLEAELDALTSFILPGGSRPGALLHHARTVCRRAERWVVELTAAEEVNTHVTVYLNRLSDYLFIAARYANKSLGQAEDIWQGESH